jgi:YggT family protein
MDVLAQILRLIVETVGGLYMTAMLLRFMLQLARADFYNPISQFIVKATNPPLIRARRIIPGFMGVDVASLVLAAVIKYAIFIIPMLPLYGLNIPFLILIPASLLAVIGSIAGLFFVIVLASIITSWVAPQSHHPAIMLIRQLAQPAMSPFQKLLPPIGGLDLSPILFFLSLQVLVVLMVAIAHKLGIPPSAILGLLGIVA